MKICSVCKERKSLSEFAFRNKQTGKRQALCRECHSVKMKKHYEDNAAKYKAKAKRNDAVAIERNHRLMVQYLSEHPCVDCGNSNPIVLDFDHQRDKLRNVSDMIRSHSWEKILEEIAKCEVVCSNCHRIRTANAFGWWRTQYIPVA